MTESSLVLDVHGVGYEVLVPGQLLSSISGTGQELKLYTYMQVREDAVVLFGFLTKDDLAMFKMLIGVNGVGPKAGLAILSALGADDLRFAVLSDDAKKIAKTPGIGTKTAQKIILELKDKMAKETAGGLDFSGGKGAPAPAMFTSKATEAAAALAVLGYSTQEVQMALKGVDVENLSLEEIIRQSLKKMVK